MGLNDGVVARSPKPDGNYYVVVFCNKQLEVDNKSWKPEKERASA